jgi:hypothetical protein
VRNRHGKVLSDEALADRSPAHRTFSARNSGFWKRARQDSNL